MWCISTISRVWIYFLIFLSDVDIKKLRFPSACSIYHLIYIYGQKIFISWIKQNSWTFGHMIRLYHHLKRKKLMKAISTYHKRLVASYMDWHINQNYLTPLTGNWCALTWASSDIMAVILPSIHWKDNDEFKYIPVTSVMQSQNVVKISQSSLRSFFYICVQDTLIAKEREGLLKLLHRNWHGEKIPVTTSLGRWKERYFKQKSNLM